MAGFFAIADAGKTFQESTDTANRIVAKAKEIAKDRNVKAPNEVGIGGKLGHFVWVRYNSNAFRDCIKDAVTQLDHEIIGQEHAGKRSGRF